MNFKTLFFLTLISITNLVYSQESINREILLEYKVSYKLGKPLTKKGYVFEYNDKKYYFTSKSNFKETITKRDVFNRVTNTRSIEIVSAGDGSESLVANNINNSLFEIRSLGNELLKSKEYLDEMNWIDTGRKDFVLNYECKIYEINFRGRHYFAHVNSEIDETYQYGPWKFNGFKGVPLLIYDSENKLKWEITKIDIKNTNDLIKLATQVEENLNKVREISLQQFMKLYDNSNGGMTLTEGYPILGSDFKKKDDTMEFKRKGLELTFEWEE